MQMTSPLNHTGLFSMYMYMYLAVLLLPAFNHVNVSSLCYVIQDQELQTYVHVK